MGPSSRVAQAFVLGLLFGSIKMSQAGWTKQYWCRRMDEMGSIGINWQWDSYSTNDPSVARWRCESMGNCRSFIWQARNGISVYYYTQAETGYGRSGVVDCNSMKDWYSSRGGEHWWYTPTTPQEDCDNNGGAYYYSGGCRYCSSGGSSRRRRSSSCNDCGTMQYGDGNNCYTCSTGQQIGRRRASSCGPECGGGTFNNGGDDCRTCYGVTRRRRAVTCGQCPIGFYKPSSTQNSDDCVRCEGSVRRRTISAWTSCASCPMGWSPNNDDDCAVKSLTVNTGMLPEKMQWALQTRNGTAICSGGPYRRWYSTFV